MTCNNCKKTPNNQSTALQSNPTDSSKQLNSVNVRKGLESLNAMREVDLKHF